LKIPIDIFKKAEEQTKTIVEQLRAIMPISMKKLRYELLIPSRFAGKAYHAFGNIGNILKQEWLNNGMLILVIDIPASRKDDLFSKANQLTHGDIEIRQVD